MNRNSHVFRNACPWQTRFAVACLAFWFAAMPVSSCWSRLAAAADLFVFIADESDSMAPRVPFVRGALELATAILDQRLQIISFNDQVRVSPEYDSSIDGDAISQWVQTIGHGGGTSYLPPLEAISADARAAVFISDGAPSESPEAVLDYLRRRTRSCPIHTIGIQAGAANKLLADIAGATGASHYRLDRGADAVEAVLSVLAEYRQCRLYRSKDGVPLSLDLDGEFLVIGHGAAPTISTPAVQWRQVMMPDGVVHVGRGAASPKKTITVAAAPEAAVKEIMVIRFDLSRSKLHLERVGVHNNEVHVKAAVEFLSPQGQIVDPRGDDTLKAAFQVLDKNGKVVRTVLASKPTAGPKFETVLKVPIETDGSQYSIRSVTAETASNVLFRASESRLVDPEAMPQAEATIASTVEAISHGPGQPMEIEVRVSPTTGSPEALQLILDDLETNAPVVEVTGPDGQRFESVAPSLMFDIGPARVEQAVFRSTMEFQGVTQPGEYHVRLKPGEAAGFSYPEARTVAACVASDQVQLLVVAANRKAGRTVLYDSHQERVRPALVGDHLSCELIRGAMNSRVFASLEDRLRARLIAEDGAVRDVQLKRQGNRFVTETTTLKDPGVMTIEVDLSVQGAQVRFTSSIEVLSVEPRLVVGNAPLPQLAPMLPQGALIPLEAAVEGRTQNGPADQDLLEETLRRGGYTVRWSMIDSAAAVIDSASAPAGLQAWKTRALVSRQGRQTLALELLAEEQVVHRISWAVNAVEPAIKITPLARRNGQLVPPPAGGSLERLAPSWLTAPIPCVIAVNATGSRVSRTHFVEAVRSGEVEAEFDEEEGAFLIDITELTSATCHALLHPLTLSHGPEIQVAHEFSFQPPRVILWPRLLALPILVLTLGWMVRRMSIWMRSDPRDQIAVLTDEGAYIALPLSAPRGFLGLRDSLVLPRDLPPDARPLPSGSDEDGGQETEDLVRIYRSFWSRKVLAKAVSDGVVALPRGVHLQLGEAGMHNIDFPNLDLPGGYTVSFQFAEEPIPQPETV